MAGFSLVVWYCVYFGEIAVLLRLLYFRLHRVYPYLFCSLLAIAVETPLLLPFSQHSQTYVTLYELAQTINLVFAVSVVLELCRAALAGQPALAGFGRKTVVFVMAAAAAIAASSAGLDAVLTHGHAWTVQLFLRIERTMDLMIVIFLLLISGFMMWFPVRVKRNIVIYIVGYAVFFGSRSFGLLAVNLLPEAALETLSAVILSFSLVCMGFWFFGLRREGDNTQTVMSHHWSPATAERLSGQLDAINAALLRFSRL